MKEAGAVRVAAAFAQRRQTTLTVVHVVGAPLLPHAHGPDPLPAAVDAAKLVAPELDVRPLARTGPVTAVLAELAEDHGLLVTGSRGHGALRDAAVGSQALALAATGHCPVVVVRPGADRLRSSAPVVAALSGGSLDAAVLDFAFAEAAQRGVCLVAARAVERLRPAGRLVLAALAPGSGADPADEVRFEIAPWCERYPEVRLLVEVTHGRPASSILDTARGAGLLVVGTRGRGPRAGLVLGSFSQAVLHHVHSPLALVPPAV
jgi:nucleotide-binding universal stress UspA family protein